MIAQPNIVTQSAFEEARAQVNRKKDLPSLSKVRLETYHEGLSAQIMHVGPYSAEPPTIEKLHHYIEENGYQIAAKHHEIYLSDARRTAPDKLKTIIRYPVMRRQN